MKPCVRDDELVATSGGWENHGHALRGTRTIAASPFTNLPTSQPVLEYSCQDARVRTKKLRRCAELTCRIKRMWLHT